MRNRPTSRPRPTTGTRGAGYATRASRAAGGGPPSIAVVVSRYHASITDRLMDGAVRAYAQAGANGTVTIVEAPGAFELVAISMAAARSGRFAGVVALGCIVKGQTRHDQIIAQAVADGLIAVTLATGVPVALGVLTVENMAQARERAGGRHGNKGQEAMDAVLHTIGAMGQVSARAARRGEGR